MMAFCESQWFSGGGGVTSTAPTSSGVMWMGYANPTTTSTLFTGVNCWTSGAGGGGTCTTTECFEYQQMQVLHLQQARLEQFKLQTEAGSKAKELLLEHLTPAQKETFNKNKWFVVEGGKSKQQYRIRADHCSINIEVMEGKKVTHKLCAHLHHSIGAPLHDHILAQKIMLEAAEDDFLKIANRHTA